MTDLGDKTAKHSWSQRSTLFIHIPKTGGTTLDAILREHYYDTPLLPSTPFHLFGRYIQKFNDPSLRYIGGHFPVSTIDTARFDKRITVLREPLECLSSGISYMNRLNGLPQHTPTESEKSGLPALMYKKFFTTHFDTGRYLLDLHYGAAQGMRDYLFDCSASDAVENIKKFTHIFDFQHFDGEVKRFLMEEGYFPYAELEKKRHYAYQPDYARARLLLSEFDEQFYQLSRPLLRRIPEDINRQYEQYREDYCKQRGLALRIHEGQSLDLRMPLGSGWHHAEQSENNQVFRWSGPDSASVQIPVAAAGMYAVYLYCQPGNASVHLSASTSIRPADFKASLLQDGNILIYRILAETGGHDWINIALRIQKNDEARAGSAGPDERERGIILGNIYICRHPQ